MAPISASLSTPYWRIGLDLMGSDTSPDSLLNAVLDGKTAFLPFEITCFVQKKFYPACRALLKKSVSKNIFLKSCAHYILPEEEPLKALVEKEDSTTRVGIFGLKNQELDAFISLGSTGALIGASTLFLKKIPFIKRPMLVAKLPSKKGSIYISDVGGNASPRASNIVQSAFLASAYASYDNPEKVIRLGLLNIGSEGHKGSPFHRDAFIELKDIFKDNQVVQFIGNVEPNVAFSGKVDALASDGLTGNIFLKTAEGMSDFIFDAISSQKEGSIDGGLSNLIPMFDYSEYPGAIVSGVEGLVIKCHGYSTSKSIGHTLLKAKELLDGQFINKYKEMILNWKI